MSKKIKTKDYEITVTPKTKDTTYVLDKKIANANDTYIQIYMKDEPPIQMYLDFTVKKGSNDLILIGLSYDSNTYYYTNATTQTIKKYLTYAKNNNTLISYCTYNEVKSVIDKGIYLATGTVSEKLYSQYGGKGNNVYKAIKEFKDGSDNPSAFYELGGNDKYDLQTDLSVNDISGNDKYTLQSAETEIYINDHKGKDSYVFNPGNMTVNDEKGNDKYTVNNNAHVSITDYEGKDKYVLKDTNSGENSYFSLNDYSGKDSYNFNNADYLRINDGVDSHTYYAELEQYIGKGGNDSYTIVSTTNFEIMDYSGNDTYKIITSSNEDANLPIIDIEGNDKYTITNSKEIYIADELGNDKYTLSGSETKKINIEDDYGDDSYKITKGANNIEITDGKGYETYNLIGTKKEIISEILIKDSQNDDKYNLSYAIGVGLLDDKGDDTYTIKQTSNLVVIQDKAGDDKLVLSGAKAKDIVCMSYNQDSEAGSLILFNQKQGNFVRIDNYYKDDYSGYAYGKIETIKAGKTLLANIPETFSDELMTNVASFLSTKYDSIQDVLLSEDTEDIAALVSIFQGKDNNQV